MKKCLWLVCALGLLAACVQVGNKNLSEPGRLTQVQEGKSTRDDVCRLWGEPNEVLRVGTREEIWVYYHGRVSEVKSLKVAFDGKGVVKQIYVFSPLE